MSTRSELSIMYQQQQYYNTAPIIISEHQQYRIQSQHQEQQAYMNKLPQYYNNKGSRHDHMMSHSLTKYNDGDAQHSINSRQQTNNFRVVSPPLSVASSSTISSTNSYYNKISENNNKSNTAKLSMPFQPSKSSTNTNLSQTGQGQKRQSTWNFTWLVFMNEKWVPFDIINQTKLEQTLTVGGTFVDITDSHFPDVKRVRVFPRNNYLSYLGVKYRLSRIMQPDAYLDHVAVAEEKQPPVNASTSTTTNNINTPTTDATVHTLSALPNSISDPPSSPPSLISSEDNRSDHNLHNRIRRSWEI